MYSKAYLEITNVCDQHCSFCPGTRRAPHFMTAEEFSFALEQLQGLTQYLYFHLMGEPTLHPLLGDFIAQATAAGFHVAITTNGSRLAQVGQTLLNSGVYKVNISVHSFESGSREAHLRYLTDCFAFADEASRRGILTVLRLWNLGVAGTLNQETLALLHETFPQDWVPGRRGARLRDKLHLEYGERFDWPDLAAPNYGERVYCYGLKDQFGILCDGTVVPCCLDHEGNIPLGNLHQQPLAQILQSPRALALRQGFQQRRAVEELCCRCGYARRFNK